MWSHHTIKISTPNRPILPVSLWSMSESSYIALWLVVIGPVLCGHVTVVAGQTPYKVSDHLLYKTAT
jgi:hypothetical protein